MNAWISQIAEIVGIGRGGINFSLSDMSQMVPDARLLWVAGAVAAFMLVAFCENRWTDHREDRKSKTRRK